MAQFNVLAEENTRLRERWQEVGAGLRPLMKELSPEAAQVTDPVNSPEAVAKFCKKAWPLFKDFVREAGQYAISFALALAKSHYPRVDLKRIEEGAAANTDTEAVEALRVGLWDTSGRVMQNVNLIDEGSTSQAS